MTEHADQFEDEPDDEPDRDADETTEPEDGPRAKASSGDADVQPRRPRSPRQRRDAIG
jgi:hypothetical protein